MINLGEFPDDKNEALMKMQMLDISQLIHRLVTIAVAQYKRAAEIMEIETDYTECLDHKSDYYPETFAPVIGFIAANFRLCRSSRQIDLFSGFSAADDDARRDWQSYSKSELDTILNNSEMVRNIVNAYCNEQPLDTFYTYRQHKAKQAIANLLRYQALHYDEFPESESRFGRIVAEVRDSPSEL